MAYWFQRYPTHWTMGTQAQPGYMAYNSMYMNGGPPGTVGYQGSGYQAGMQSNGKNTAIFKKRFDRIDWKKLAAADVDHIAGNLDYHTLQDNIHNVAFCNIESELDLRSVDPNFVKLYKLAQLTIEYLLFSQEYLNSKGKELELAFKKEKEDHEASKKQLEKVKEELSEMKRESHKRKKMILAQQQILQAGQNSYNKCPYCSKAFVNATFLQSHLMRRHMDGITQYNSMITSQMQQSMPPQQVQPPQQTPIQQQGSQQLSQSTPLLNGSAASSPNTQALEKQVDEIRERLHMTESQLVEERNNRNSLLRKEKSEQTRRELEAQKDMDKWKHDQLELHRGEMDKMRDIFMKELKELNEKLNLSEQRFYESQQKQIKKQSNLGTLKDDIELDKEELAKQREEVAMLKEQLTQQRTQVQDLMDEKLSQKEEVWKDRLKDISQSHEQQLVQLRKALESSMKDLERERETKGEAESAYQQRMEDMQRMIKQSKEAEKKLRDQAKNMEKQASRQPPPKAAEPAPPARQQAPPPAAAAAPSKPQHSMEPELEDDDTTELEATDTFGGTSTMGTKTFPTFGTGTLSLSEARNGRVSELLKQNPGILQQFKTQLNDILDQELEKRGVKPGSRGMSIGMFNSKMQLLKGERQQKAKKHKNFFDIRQHYLNQIDLLAKDRVKSMHHASSPPAGASHSPQKSPTRPSRPTSAPTALAKGDQKERLGRSAPLPSSSIPAPQQSKQPPKPAPRATSPRGRNGASVSMSMSTGQSITANSTVTSSQWDSDLDDDDDDDEDEMDGNEVQAQVFGNKPKSQLKQSTGFTPQGAKPKQVRYQDEEEEDDEESYWDDEVSELEEPSSVHKPTKAARPAVTVPTPKGGMVAELSRSIELQLQGRQKGKKPAGAVNTLSFDDDDTTEATTTAGRRGQKAGANDAEDDSFSTVSSVDDDEESAPPKPSARRGHAPVRSSLQGDTGSYSTNTYGTSMWGSSSRAPSTAMPHTGGGPTSHNHTQGSVGKTSMNVSEWDSDDDLNIDELG